MTSDEIYRLIPAYYHVKDSEHGQPLKALISIISEQAAVMEKDISDLYDNWFIETCDEWIVPYIGDLLGVEGMIDIKEGTPVSRRAFIGNTIAYRRRKGTARVIEQLAYDITGWRARAYEFFVFLAWTQHVNHPRLRSPYTALIRDAGKLEHAGTPFDTTPRTGDVRRIAIGRGKYNIPNLGVFLWRIQTYRMIRSESKNAGSNRRFYIHPAGYDMAVFHSPYTEIDIGQETGEENVPAPLRRRPLYEELEARRQSIVDGKPITYQFFDDRPGSRFQPVFELFFDNSDTPISPGELQIADLSTWDEPNDTKNYIRINPDGTSDTIALPIKAAIDPVLGRITLSPSVAGSEVRCTCGYGFSGDIGGGPYDRQGMIEDYLDRDVLWHKGVSKEPGPVGSEIVATLDEAITDWKNQPPGTFGIISIMDNSSYPVDLTGAKAIEVPESSKLLIIAANWPSLQVKDGIPGEMRRIPGFITADGLRPHILGSIEVKGTAPPGSELGGEVIFDGLLIEDSISVSAGNLRLLRISHSTVIPGTGSIAVPAGNPDLRLIIDNCLCGPVTISPEIEIEIHRSIIQAPGFALDAPGSIADISESTLLGETRVKELTASDTIFQNNVEVERKQTGCVRYSYVEPGSETPRRFRCQPDFACKDVDPGEADAVRARIKPLFTSVTFGHYAYAQLADTCAAEIRTGSEDGSHMGVFCFLKIPQRLRNLNVSLGGYIPYGMESGVFFVT